MKYLLRLSYFGGAFAGFQVQNGGAENTVQGALCRAGRALFGVECAVSGCSRTDAGVHALDFAATLEVESKTAISPEKLPRALMAHLPPEISVSSAVEVLGEYSVRRHVLGKEYEYLILNSRTPSPFYVGRAWHVPHALDVEKMNAAAKYFVGEHDFSAFMASGSDVADTVRNVSFCTARSDGNLIKINIFADGFLYNMVRIIVGTLVYVGEGKISPDMISDIIKSGDRSRAGITAPPDGLYLKRVTLN